MGGVAQRLLAPPHRRHQLSLQQQRSTHHRRTRRWGRVKIASNTRISSLGLEMPSSLKLIKQKVIVERHI